MSRANDVNNAMFSNIGRAIVGVIGLNGMAIIGSKMLSPTMKITKFFDEVNALSQSWKYKKAFSIVSNSFWRSKANPVGLIIGIFLAGLQIHGALNAIWGSPDFNSGKWIIY